MSCKIKLHVDHLCMSGDAAQEDHFTVQAKCTKLYYQFNTVPPSSFASQKYSSIASIFTAQASTAT